MSQSFDGFTWKRLDSPVQRTVQAVPPRRATEPGPRRAGPPAARAATKPIPWAQIGLGAIIALWAVLGLYRLGQVGYPMSITRRPC